jgi:hypothetical protein
MLDFGRSRMRLPADCPYSTKPPPLAAAETIACCRAQSRYRLVREDEEPLCRTMRTEAEVYRFTWRSSFDGDAVVRWGGSVARSRSDASIALPWSGTPIAVRVLLTMSDWTGCRTRRSPASFWALDPEEAASRARRLGLVDRRAPQGHLSCHKQMEPGRSHLRPRQAVFGTGRPALGRSRNLLKLRLWEPGTAGGGRGVPPLRRSNDRNRWGGLPSAPDWGHHVCDRDVC